MKKVLLLLVIGLFLFAQNPEGDSVGEPKINYKLSSKNVADFLDGYAAPRIIWAWNNNADSIRDGDVVIWDSIAVEVVAGYDASGAGAATYDTCTIADSAEAVHWQKVYGDFTDPSNDTIIVVGLDSVGETLRDTIVKATTRGIVYSDHYFRKIDLVYVMNSNDSIGLYAVPHGCVKHTTDGGSHFVAGVVQAGVADDELVKILVFGVDDVKIKGATTAFLPGAWLQTTTTAGYAAPVVTANAGFGRVLTSGNTDGSYPCLITPIGMAMTGIGGYASLDSLLLANGYKVTNPHADTAYHDEVCNKFSGDIRIMDNDIDFGNGASIKNKHADSLGYDEKYHDFGAGIFISDAEFTFHIGAFDFIFAASGVTYIQAEGCVHPTAAAEAIYAPMNIPFNLLGGTIVIDTIMVFFNTDASGDDFDFSLISTDHDGSVTTLATLIDIGNGGTGADSLACITTDVALTNYACYIELDVNNAGAATDVKIYDIRFVCHLE